MSSLITAIQNEEVKVALQLITPGSDLLDVKTSDGKAPLEWASRYGQLQTARALINAGADVNTKDNNGSTPLHSASRYGKDEIVKVLISAGADVNAKTTNGMTPLHAACVPHSNCGNHHVAICQALIAAGAKVNTWANNGTTPLHTVVYGVYSNAPLTEALLAAGSDVHATATCGKTPLNCASEYFGFPGDERKRMGKALIAAGADVNMKGEGGRTPLFLACVHNDADMVEALLAAGADPSIEGEDGRSALAIAKGKNNAEIINMLKRDTNRCGKTSVEPLPCFLELPAGVIVQVGNFLPLPLPWICPYDETREPNELMNFCVVLGRKLSKVLRQDYLQHNLEYLRYIYRLAGRLAIILEDDFDVIHDYPKAVMRQTLLILNSGLREWMQWNGWWKNAARSAIRHHFDSSTEASHQYPPSLFKRLHITTCDDYPNMSGYIRLDVCIGYLKDREHSIHRDTNESFFSDCTLQLIQEDFAEIFFNPALVTALGMLELLQFQMEELKFDVNKNEAGGIVDVELFQMEELNFDMNKIEARGVVDVGLGLGNCPLLFHALFQPFGPLFDFLVSHEDLVVNPNPYEAQSSLLHRLPQCFDEYYLDDWLVDMERVKRILQKSKDEDLESHNSKGNTPLDELCEVFRRSKGLNARLIELAKLYLSRGAKVTNRALGAIEECRKWIHDYLREEEEIEVAERQLKQMSDLLNPNKE